MFAVAGISRNHTLTSLVKTDLSNKPVVCTTGVSTVACAVPQNHTNNELSYDINKIRTSDT